MAAIPANLEQDVKELISNVTGLSVDKLELDKNFWTDLGVDSIKAIEITVAIERRYKISMRDEQIAQISTIRQSLEAIKKALAAKKGK